jgi:hypothetical protein
MPNAAFSKFNSTAYDKWRGAFNLSSDSIKAMLTNVAPDPNSHYYTDLQPNELVAGNGYVQGGAIVPSTSVTNAAGVVTFNVGAVTWVSSIGSMGPYRYVVYYDDSAANKNLLGFYDLGASLVLNGLNSDIETVAPNGGALFVDG